MHFSPAPPNEVFTEHRWLSETGRWELGLQPVIFGVRVQLALVGDMGPTLNYCAGANRGQILQLLVTVVQALERYPESSSRTEIAQAFPDYTIKPIFNDPTCWTRLQEMAQQQPPAQKSA